MEAVVQSDLYPDIEPYETGWLRVDDIHTLYWEQSGNPEGLGPRELVEPEIGDAIVIEGAGAYCASMSSKNYNSFPECAEVLLDRGGQPRLIRRRQTLDQMLENEVIPD